MSPLLGHRPFLWATNTKEERAITHYVGPLRIGGRLRLQMQPGPKSKRAFRNTEELKIIKFLVIHLTADIAMNDIERR
jgi:hypothetical protein